MEISLQLWYITIGCIVCAIFNSALSEIMLKNNFEVDVKVKCTEEGMTQAKIAEEIGTSPQYVSRLIKNNDKIVNQTFIRIMEKLGYDVKVTYEQRGKDT
ncbi:helix-turn-helix transcriptional regulator [Selenomonas ruminantium]|uniref:helix-turn-helix domain-containing protein n=1 Tax=Selenomonas ruminantium TaxID=971 RepID=UPI0026F1693B|nr:helix-turn-helix transcriptional regulator [Selenomonas ruminantium]